MKISIVLPAFNAEKYIEQSIQSVINQTTKEWELIIVNDGSTDSTSKICEQYAEKYPDEIKVFHKKNEGQFLTRLYGIQQCKGEYIGFLDADDRLHEEYVSRLLKCIKEYQPDIICFGFVENRIDREKYHKLCEDTRLFKTKEDRTEVYENIVTGKLTGSMWSKLFKREMLLNEYLENCEVESKRYGEDAFQSFDAFRKAKSICFMGDLLYFYQINNEGASQGFEKRELNYFNTKYVFELLVRCIDEWGVRKEDFTQKLYARNFNETVYCILKLYRSAKTSKRRREIVAYDWTQYLLDVDEEQIYRNENIRQSYLKVWKAFRKKQYINIFIREKFRKIIGW